MLSIFFIVLVAASQLTTTRADGCSRIVCYHTNWSQYRPSGGKFFPQDIDPTLCTHMIYAFAKLTGNHLAAFEWNDDSTDWSVGLFEKFQNLKQRNPNVKTLLAVGGWNLGSAPFTRIVGSSSNRHEFIQQAIKFLRDRNFDGLDLDWEYPANRGSPPQDRQHFTELVTELKAAFVAEAQSSGKDRLLLSAAVAAGKDKIDTAYDIPAINRELDFINLMTYDLHGSWEKNCGHNSPLYARRSETGLDRNLNLDFAAQYWVQKGADRSKLNIGMGLYGRSFQLASASNYDVGASCPRAGQAGHYTREAGFIAYYEVCDMIKAGGQVEMIADQQVPFVHQGTQWVGYDNPASLREKVRYVKQNNFGGVMVWALPLDDFSGNHCGDGPFPLMHAINDECHNGGGTLQTAAPPDHNAHTTQPPSATQSPGGSGTHTTKAPGHSIEQTDEFTCPEQDGFYASPENCNEYFICASHISYGVRCADGLIFNANSGFCDWPRNYHCTAGGSQPAQTQPPQHTQAPVHTQPPHTQPPHTQPPAHTQAPGGNTGDVNNFCKNNDDGLHADPTDCAYFIECAGGRTYREKCAPGTAWNSGIKTCDMLDNVGCDHSA